MRKILTTLIIFSLLLSALALKAETVTFPPDSLANPYDVFPYEYVPPVLNSLFPHTSWINNTVTVNSGTIGGHVFGGIAAGAAGRNADANTVIINGGTIGGTTAPGGNVTGGWTDFGSVTNNTINITGSNSTTIYGIVFGGWINGGSGNSAINNTVTITGSNVTLRDNVYGAYTQGGTTMTGNIVNITDSSVWKLDAIIAGAYSALNTSTITGNSVTIGGAANVRRADIYGGRGQGASIIQNNTVTINGGTIDSSGSGGTIYGGHNFNGSGAVTSNTVNILGGTINIPSGTVNTTIYGGASTRGAATGNTVTIGGTAVLNNVNLYGGSANAGYDAFTGNTLNKNNDTAVGTAQNFQFVNFGYTGNANIAMLNTTPTGSTLSGITLNTNTNDIIFGGTMTGTGDLTKTGTGTLILTGDSNSLPNKTIQIQGGTLQLGNGGTTGSIAASGFNTSAGAALAYNHSNTVTETRIISGGGNLIQQGSGTLILTAANTYTGSTTITTGTLQLGNGGTTGSIAAGGNVVNNGTLVFNRSDNVRFDNIITGSGHVRQTGTGTLTLTGSNTYTGGTEIERGTVNIAGATSYGTGSFTFTGADRSGETKNITVQSALSYPPTIFPHSFRTQTGAGSKNYVDLTAADPLVIAGNSISGNGGAFYVAAGTSMTVATSDLLLMSNTANSLSNDLYVEAGGTFNLNVGNSTVIGTGIVVFASGINGSGTLNITNNSAKPTVVKFDGDTGGKTFHMGTTNVKGTGASPLILTMTRDNSLAPRVLFENSGTFNLTGSYHQDGNDLSTVLSGDGIVEASTVNVTNYGTLLPADMYGTSPTTLTLRADTVNLNEFILMYRSVSPQMAISIGGDGIPVSNNSLLNIESGDVTLKNGIVAISTPLTAGDYLVIRSNSGFNNISDDTALNNQLKAEMDGFWVTRTTDGPRGGYTFALGDDSSPTGTGNNVWFTPTLNSLSMDWTDTSGAAWRKDDTGSHFTSFQQIAGKPDEHHFLPGDKVHIAGTFNIALPGDDITVSGLVVGQNAAGVSPTGDVTIRGEGGIMANDSSAFGKYLTVGTAEKLVPTGKLEKYGNGTLTFTNTGGNTFKEGIDLHGGKVQFNRADQLGDGGKGIHFINDAALWALDDVTLANTMNIASGKIGTLGVAAGKTLTYNGTITGTSPMLNKSGTGTLRLDTDITSDVTISQGTLTGMKIIDGVVTVKNGGTLKPGGDLLGTFLTVKGDLTFEQGSNLEVRLEHGATNDSDFVKVIGGGNVVIQDGANLNVKIDFWGNQHWNFSDHFTVIDASSGTVDDSNAEFNLRSSGLPRGIKLEQGWQGAEYQLRLDYDPDNGYETLCTKHNRVDIGKSLDWFIANRDSSIAGLIDQLSGLGLTDKEICTMLDQITGDLTPNALFMALKEPWRHPFNRVSLGCPIHKTNQFHRQLWGEFTARYDNVGYDGNAHDFTINRNGLAVGVDQRITQRSVIGVTFQYAEPRLRQETGKVEMGDNEIGLYGMTRLTNSVDMKAYLGYSHQQYDFTRTVSLPAFHETLCGSTNGDAMAASIELLQPMRWRQGILITPVAAFDFEQAWFQGYRESAGEAVLVYDNATLARAMLRVGLGGEYIWRDRFLLTTRLQYAAQLNDREYPAIGVRFANGPGNQHTADIWGSQIGRDYVNFGLGVNWKLTSRGDKLLYVNYDAKWFNLATSHVGEAGIVKRW